MVQSCKKKMRFFWRGNRFHARNPSSEVNDWLLWQRFVSCLRVNHPISFRSPPHVSNKEAFAVLQGNIRDHATNGQSLKLQLKNGCCAEVNPTPSLSPNQPNIGKFEGGFANRWQGNRSECWRQSHWCDYATAALIKSNRLLFKC